jgi:hypothetical protein
VAISSLRYRITTRSVQLFESKLRRKQTVESFFRQIFRPQPTTTSECTKEGIDDERRASEIESNRLGWDCTFLDDVCPDSGRAGMS